MQPGCSKKDPRVTRPLQPQVLSLSVIPCPDGDARHQGRRVSIWFLGPDPDLKWIPLVSDTVASCLLPQMTPAWHLQGTPYLQCPGETCWSPHSAQCMPVQGQW